VLAREIMTSPAVTVTPDTTLKHVIQLLDHHAITSVPVVDADERLVGIVSEADLLRGEVEPDPRAHLRPVPEETEPPRHHVADVMTPHVLTVSERTDGADIARLMLDNGIKSVPVVRDRHVVGVVSRRDLLHVLARDDDRIRAEVEDRLREYAGDAQWTVTVEDGEVALHGHASEEQQRVATILARTVLGVVRVEAAPAASPRVG
jgi:CBS domain-containing protein